MIHNDLELKATQERITYFYGLLAQFRIAIPAPDYHLMASGYLSEIEKMQTDVMNYLRHHPSEVLSAEAA